MRANRIRRSCSWLVQRGWVISLVFALVSCTREQDYLDVMQDQREAMNEATVILETVQDENSMSAAKSKLDELGKKFEVIAARANALPKPPQREVLARMQDDRFLTQRATERLTQEAQRVRRLPGGAAFWRQFESSSQGLFQAVQP